MTMPNGHSLPGLHAIPCLRELDNSSRTSTAARGVNLHIVRNEVVYDSRVLKETRELQESGLFQAIVIAGFEKQGLQESEDIDGRHLWRVPIMSRTLPKDPLSQAIKFLEWRHRAVGALKGLPLSVIHCHDLEPLPIAVKLKRLTGARLVYDAHELETERTNLGAVQKRVMRVVESRLSKFVNAMITVSPSIQSWYGSRYPNLPVSLVRNIPSPTEVGRASTDLKDRLGVSASELLFIFSGGLGAGRSIEPLLEAFSHQGVPHHVLFMGDGIFAEKIRRAARQCERIHWMAPVLPHRVLPTLAAADIGLSLIEDISLSYRFCLPNKLFEYWQAGLPVLASNLPDQGLLVSRYEAGWLVATKKDQIAARLMSITGAELSAVRSGVDRVKHDLTWQGEAKVLLSVYKSLLGLRGDQLREGCDS